MWNALKSALVALTLLAGMSTAMGASPLPKLTVLCYHDIVDSMEGADPDAVTTEEFSSQMMLLKTRGYNVISIQDYLDYKAGKKDLPPKAVILTFDDGYQSYYTHVFPLLRAMNFPSTLAVIGSWEDQKLQKNEALHSPVNNAKGKKLPLVTPAQIKELSESPLVEIASHSYDLHYGVKANVQGSEVPAAAARIFNGQYETEQEYISRLKTDLQRNSDYLKSITGKAPRVMIWPYGKYNTQGLIAAKETGHLISFGLDDFDYETEGSIHLGRLYVSASTRLSWFDNFVKNQVTVAPARKHQAAQITGDAFDSSGLSEIWLSGLVQTSHDSGASLISLSPFEAGATTCTPLFPVPGVVHKDILSKVFWQIQTRTDAKVLLDVNLATCGFTEVEWETVIEHMLKMVPAHGIIVRGAPTQATLVQRLLSKAYGTKLQAITASNIEGLKQSFQLVQVDACMPPGAQPLIKAPHIQYEVNITKCDGKPLLERLLANGIRNFGTNQGALKADGKLSQRPKFFNQGLLAMGA